MVNHSSSYELRVTPGKKTVSRQEIESELFTQQNNDDFFAGTPIVSEPAKKYKPVIDSEKETAKPIKESSGHKKSYVLAIVLAILLLSGLVIWQNYDTVKRFVTGGYKNKSNQSLNSIIDTTSDSSTKYTDDSKTAATGQATTTQEPTATTATTTIDKSAIAISVLNGSGVKNSASSVAATLKTAGFNVKNTSNAKTFGYLKTYIYYKTGKEDQANSVKEALSGRDLITEINSSVVGSSYDIVVVVGKN